MRKTWTTEATRLCIWLALGVREYEMKQIRENTKESNKKWELTYSNYGNTISGLWFLESDIYESVADFMSVLDEKISFDPNREFNASKIASYLYKFNHHWQVPVVVPQEPEIDLGDILPGEFSEFGFSAVLEATMRLMPGTKNDTPLWWEIIQKKWVFIFQKYLKNQLRVRLIPFRNPITRKRFHFIRLIKTLTLSFTIPT